MTPPITPSLLVLQDIQTEPNLQTRIFLPTAPRAIAPSLLIPDILPSTWVACACTGSFCDTAPWLEPAVIVVEESDWVLVGAATAGCVPVDEVEGIVPPGTGDGKPSDVGEGESKSPSSSESDTSLSSASFTGALSRTDILSSLARPRLRKL